MNKDYTPITPTAWMIAYIRTLTDIPYATEIFDEFERLRQSQGEGPVPEELKQSDIAPQIEARYKIIDREIKRNGAKQILEIASGLSPRGLDLSKDPSYHYVEFDLPAITKQKEEIARILGGQRANLTFRSGNALDPHDLEEAVKFFDKAKPLIITNEGLLRYLNMEEKAIVAKNVLSILSDFEGVWITPDITLRKVLLADRLATDGQVDKIMKDTGVDMSKNRFETAEEAQKFFENLGFSVERYGFDEMASELVSPQRLGLSKEQTTQLLESPELCVMRPKAITPDEVISYLENIPEDKQKLVLPSGRTIKDIVVHLAGWKLEATSCYIALCEKGTKPWFFGKKDLSEFNKELDDKYKHLSYKEAISLLKKSYEGRAHLINKYGKDNLLDAGLGWMFEDNVESHAILHIEQIKKALGQ